MDLGTESFVSGWLRVGLLRENVRNACFFAVMAPTQEQFGLKAQNGTELK